MGIVSEIFEAYREKLEEEYELWMEGQVVCDECGNIFPHHLTISCTRGTFCQEHF